MRARLMVTACLMAMTGCASPAEAPQSAPASDDVTGTPEARVTATPPKDLTCPTNERVNGIYDFADSKGGKATPEEAAHAFEKGGRIVIDDTSAGTIGWVLRPDGTASKKLDVVGLEDGTWRVQSYEGC